jgi:hypothetical protein
MRSSGWFVGVAVWVGLWACGRSEVSYELTVTEKGKGAVEEAAKTRLDTPLAEVARECAEVGGAACQTLLARRAEVEAGGEVSKQAWVEALAKGCLRGMEDSICQASIAAALEFEVVPQVDARCEGGEWRACALLGEVHSGRVSSRKNTGEQEEEYRKAANYLERACSKERWPWCERAIGAYGSAARLAGLHGAREAARSDLVRVASIGEPFCGSGDDAACLRAIHALVSDELDEETRDHVRARSLSRTACDEVRRQRAKAAMTCTAQAESLILGLGGERDVEGGRKLFDEVCAREVVDDATEAACRSLAYLHAGHLEVLPAEPERARGYAKRACEVLGKLRPDADCFVAREVEDLLK